MNCCELIWRKLCGVGFCGKRLSDRWHLLWTEWRPTTACTSVSRSKVAEWFAHRRIRVVNVVIQLAELLGIELDRLDAYLHPVRSAQIRLTRKTLTLGRTSGT